MRSLSPQAQYDLAVKAVFQGAPMIVRGPDDALYHYQSGQLVWAPFGAVLILPARHDQAFAATAGTLGVFYLEEDGAGFRPAGRWPHIVDGATMGNPPDWTISSAFGSVPMIIATAGGMWQGVRCGSTILVELTPSGPAERATFRSDFDNTATAIGVAVPESIQGQVAHIVDQVSFEVVYTGTRQFTHRYHRAGERYEREDLGRTPELPAC